MRKLLTLTGVAAVIALLASGCTVHPARDGRLVQKYEVEPWVETVVSTSCTTSGSITTCVPIVHATDHPRSWWVRIYSDEAAQEGKESGRGVYAYWPIHKTLWDRLEPDQHVHVGKYDEAPH